MADIYNYYVENSVYTFDEELSDEQYFIQKLKKLEGRFPCLGLEEKGKLAGYAYASPFAHKSGYRFTAESTIYLDYQFGGRGYGMILYTELLKQLKESGIKNAIGILGLPNKASESLHRKLGFFQVGGLKGVGWKFGKWIDTGYWQLDLEKWEPGRTTEDAES